MPRNRATRFVTRNNRSLVFVLFDTIYMIFH